MAQLFGSGSILNEALRAQQILAERYQVPTDVWSVPSYNELRREALAVDRWNRLHPAERPRTPYIVSVLAYEPGPIIASSDYMKALAGSTRAVARLAAAFARHRRFRAQRKSRAPAPLLRDFRRGDRAGDARGAGQNRRDQFTAGGSRYCGAGISPG